MRIGYLGPKGTFSQEACIQYASYEKEMIEYKTIQETITALVNSEVDEAIVPIENSLQGCVTDSLDTLIENENIFVRKEILLEIKQNLMANGNFSFEEIEEVYSHPQALSQCKRFLEENLPNAKITAVESTAYSAKLVSENIDRKIACIGNIACLKEYNLNLLKEGIQDNSFNKTKFWVLGKEESENENKSKMSLIFSVKDKPGALYNVLKIFNEYNLNLTKIESRPAKTVLGEYVFLIDVTIEDFKENLAIDKIRQEGIFVRILGKY